MSEPAGERHDSGSNTPNKAYLVRVKDCDEGGQIIVFAPNPSKAKQFARKESFKEGDWSFVEADWIELQVQRARDFDNAKPPLTQKDYLERGWHWPCPTCERAINEDLAFDAGIELKYDTEGDFICPYCQPKEYGLAIVEKEVWYCGGTKKIKELVLQKEAVN